MVFLRVNAPFHLSSWWGAHHQCYHSASTLLLPTLNDYDTTKTVTLIWLLFDKAVKKRAVITYPGRFRNFRKVFLAQTGVPTASLLPLRQQHRPKFSIGHPPQDSYSPTKSLANRKVAINLLSAVCPITPACAYLFMSQNCLVVKM